MNPYSLVLFVHIGGALGSFVTLALEWMLLYQLRQARSAETALPWTGLSDASRRLGMASMLALVASGIYLAFPAWGPASWIVVTLAAMPLMILLINTLTRPRMLALRRVLADETGPLSPRLQALAASPLLLLSNRLRLAITLGIVFLMTIKPGLSGSLLTLAAAFLLGLAFSLPALRGGTNLRPAVRKPRPAGSEKTPM